jgi:hypothetical protein
VTRIIGRIVAHSDPYASQQRRNVIRESTMRNELAESVQQPSQEGADLLNVCPLRNDARRGCGSCTRPHTPHSCGGTAQRQQAARALHARLGRHQPAGDERHIRTRLAHDPRKEPQWTERRSERDRLGSARARDCEEPLQRSAYTERECCVK